MEKTYKEPKFEIVLSEKANRAFFTASGNGGFKLPKLSKTTGAW